MLFFLQLTTKLIESSAIAHSDEEGEKEQHSLKTGAHRPDSLKGGRVEVSVGNLLSQPSVFFETEPLPSIFSMALVSPVLSVQFLIRKPLPQDKKVLK